MNTQFSLWLRDKWSRGDVDAAQLANDYRATFTTQAGNRVLQHMISEIYSTILEPASVESQNPQALAGHNARRSVIHEILDNIDLAENVVEMKEDNDGS